jgi:RNA polymerase sigma-70 factor (ECF subfamily)
MIGTVETAWSDTSPEAFQEAVERYRYQLQVHCYRMLGSLTDAEDLVQETFLRAWRARDRFEGRTSFRNWLYRIATNACLNAIATSKHAKRIWPDAYGPPATEPPVGQAAHEVPWLEPYPDVALETVSDIAPGPDARYELRESVQLAFISAIQELPPRQRAVLLLRDVLGFSAAESAELLETTVTSINSALQRARATLDRLPPTPQHHATADEQATLERYVRTWESTDIDGFVALLKEDAILRMPPWPHWYLGRRSIKDFFLWVWNQRRERTWRLISTSANGQPAIAHYAADRGTSVFVPHNIEILTLDRDGIAVLTAFRAAEFPKFGLPESLGAQ